MELFVRISSGNGFYRTLFMEHETTGQIFHSDNMDFVISAALFPVALASAFMLAAKKYVLSAVSMKPINHPFTS